MLTPREAADLLGVCVDTIRRQIDRGLLPAVDVGTSPRRRALRIHASAIAALRDRAAETPQRATHPAATAPMPVRPPRPTRTQRAFRVRAPKGT